MYIISFNKNQSCMLSIYNRCMTKWVFTRLKHAVIAKVSYVSIIWWAIFTYMRGNSYLEARKIQRLTVSSHGWCRLNAFCVFRTVKYLILIKIKYFTVLNTQNALSLHQPWLLTVYLILVASSHHISNPSDSTSVFTTFNLMLG